MRRSKAVNTPKAPTLPAGYRWGKDISPEELQYAQVALTPEGDATAYLGFLGLKQTGDPFLFSVYVAGRSEERRKSYRFVELRGGSLRLSRFLSDNTAYALPELKRLCLPRGANNYFGVTDRDGKLDEELTRYFFGATFQELDEFLGLFYTTVRHPFNPTWKSEYARITFSKTRDNDCDLSGYYVPQNFPFIAFEGTEFFGGHISLAGFYRHLAFLCHYRDYSGRIEGDAFFLRLVQNGAKPELIVQLCKASFATYGPALTDPAEAFRFVESFERDRIRI